MRREREQTQPWIFFHVIYCSSHILVHLFSLQGSASGVKSLFGTHYKIGLVIFPVFTSSWRVSDRKSLPRSVRPPSNTFLLSILGPLLMTFSLESPSTNQNPLPISCLSVSIFNPGGCWYTRLAFTICFFFFIYASFFTTSTWLTDKIHCKTTPNLPESLIIFTSSIK